MANAGPKGRHRLAAEHASRRVCHRTADDDWQALSRNVKKLFNGKQRGFGIEGVKNGFYQQHVCAALKQALHLLVVRRAQLLKRDVARAWVVHIWANAGSFGGRAYRAQYKPRLVWGRELVTSRACQLGRLDVHFIGQIGHVIVILCNTGRAKGVGFNHIGTSGQIALVHVGNDVWTGQAQQLVVAFNVFMKIFKPLTAVLRFTQLKPLNHCAHGTVKHRNPLGQNSRQGLTPRVDVFGGRGCDSGVHGSIVRSWCCLARQSPYLCPTIEGL